MFFLFKMSISVREPETLLAIFQLQTIDGDSVAAEHNGGGGRARGSNLINSPSLSAASAERQRRNPEFQGVISLSTLGIPVNTYLYHMH